MAALSHTLLLHLKPFAWNIRMINRQIVRIMVVPIVALYITCKILWNNHNAVFSDIHSEILTHSLLAFAFVTNKLATLTNK